MTRRLRRAAWHSSTPTILLECPQSALTVIASASEYMASKMTASASAKNRMKALAFFEIVDPVLRVGGIYDTLACLLKAPAIGIARMTLAFGTYIPAIVVGIGLQYVKLDRCSEQRKIDRKRRIPLLAAKRVFDVFVTGMYHDSVAEYRSG